jgi:hypothetical protein
MLDCRFMAVLSNIPVKVFMKKEAQVCRRLLLNNNSGYSRVRKFDWGNTAATDTVRSAAVHFRRY